MNPAITSTETDTGMKYSNSFARTLLSFIVLIFSFRFLEGILSVFIRRQTLPLVLLKWKPIYYTMIVL